MSERRRSSVVEVQRKDDDVLRLNDDTVRKMSQSHAQMGTEINEARDATAREHNMSVRDSIRLYKKAIAFSLIMSLAVVMEGYVSGLWMAMIIVAESDHLLTVMICLLWEVSWASHRSRIGKLSYSPVVKAL